MAHSVTHKVWILVSSNAALIDISSAFEVFRRAGLLSGSTGYDIATVTTTNRSILLLSGLGLTSHFVLSDAMAHGLPHTCIVAGGDPRVAPGSDEAHFADWLREHGKFIPRVCSICTGSFVLGQAGLLDGRAATTHWSVLDQFRRRFPNARVRGDSLFTRDGPVWTSAGMTAGIDMSLALVEQDCGYDCSLTVARFMVLFLRRSGSQRQFSSALAAQDLERESLRDLQVYIASRLGGDLTIERLAEASHMSARNLCRVFKLEVGSSIGRFVRASRLDEARRLLQDTNLDVTRVAQRVGCKDESTLRRWFMEEFGISPSQYRERFGKLNEPQT